MGGETSDRGGERRAAAGCDICIEPAAAAPASKGRGTPGCGVSDERREGLRVARARREADTGAASEEDGDSGTAWPGACCPAVRCGEEWRGDTAVAWGGAGGAGAA